MKPLVLTFVMGVLFVMTNNELAQGADPLLASNVVWDSPSQDSSGSMPIGNGDIGANVWVDPNGDLLLLISKTDAWCQNSRLLKLGRVRITLSPNPLTAGKTFRQELNLRKGAIEVTLGAPDAATTLRVWIDANRPVVHVESQGRSPHEMTARLELWRTEKRPFHDYEWFSCWHMRGTDFDNKPKDLQLYVTPDTVADVPRGLCWYHRNEESVWPIGMKLQGFESVMGQFKDPLLHRTFGAAIRGAGFEKTAPNTLTAKPAASHSLAIYPLTAQTDTAQAWLDQLNAAVDKLEKIDLARARAEHEKWWNDFWNRSYVRVSGTPDADAVTQAYTLQRWVSACGGRGGAAIKFNGSIFTVERKEGGKITSDPDYRSWGGDYWWQNTRLPYWPMLGSGDFDLMTSMFKMYFDSLDLAKARSKTWYDCQGAFMPETMSFWGMFSNGDYGWNRQGKPVGEMINPYIRWIWASGLDLALMMLDYYEYTQDAAFLKEVAIPWTDQVLLYVDTRFKRDEAGKIRLDPTQSIETYQSGVVNDTPTVAGLAAITQRMLALPANLVDPAARQRWQKLAGQVPPLPTAILGGKKVITPAQKFEGRANVENPELYTVFPFRIYGVGKGDLQLGLDTFNARAERACQGWQQNSLQAALLGLAGEAKGMLVSNARTKHAESRFPAFWGPNYDWIPDQCHGGNILNTLQTMLLQCEGKRIILMPAWPKEWQVQFKLHAPLNTTIEGIYRDGKVADLKVTPASRGADVVQMNPQ